MNTLTKIEESVVEVYGEEYHREIQKRLRYYLIKRNTDEV